MIVCYILSYYSPNYIRTQTLTQALNEIENVTLIEARNTNPGISRYFQTLFRLLKIRIRKHPDVYILGFRGYEIYWPVRLLTLGKILIFDHFMSPYDSLINETDRIKQGSILDKLVYTYEKAILKNANLVLTDTYSHQKFFAQQFDISKEKIHAIPVGANEKLFFPKPQHPSQHNKEDTFTILYYSTYLPLHGIDIILESARILQSYPIHFTLILGRLKKLQGLFNEINITELTNVAHIPWVKYSDLPEWVNNADLCLGGPFGNTGQARRVIAGKTFQFLAMAKPAVIGQIDYDYGFSNQKNCLLVPQGDANALAQSILWGFHHRQELDAIGKYGREFYMNNFSLRVIRNKLATILEQLVD